MRRGPRIVRLLTIALALVVLAQVPAAISAPEDLLGGGYYTIATWPAGARVFAAPGGVAVDSAGNVYVADTRNHVVKKLSSAGVVLGEWGGKGSGQGEFNEPAAVAVSSSGDIYVADTQNNRVQVLASDGSFVREWGSAGNGTGEFAAPAGIALDSSGNVYVSDTWNGRIQKFTSTGAYVTSWGSTGPGDGEFDGPRGVAVGTDGSVYVADVNNKRIQKFNSSGSYVTQWGPVPDGTGGYTSRYAAPYGVYATSAGVFVADAGNHFIERCSTTGSVLNTWGTEGSGASQFQSPEDVTVDATGTIYVADTLNNRIGIMNSSGTWQGAWTSGGSGDGELASAEDISLDATGSIYVADTGNHRIQRLDGDGSFVLSMGSQGSGAAQVDTPSGVAVSGAGVVYAADTGNDRIQTYDTSGTAQGSFGSGTLAGPRGVDVAPDGTVWVADSDNDQVVHYSAAGVYLGAVGSSGNGNGQLNDPRDVSVDATGTIWVCDTGNNRVQWFDSAGTYQGKWGSWDAGGPTDGLFQTPEKLALGPDGDVYVTDYGHNRVQRFTPDGEFRIAFGTQGGSTGEMNWPSGVAVNDDGDVLVTEKVNHRVQVWGYDEAPPTTTAFGIPVGWSSSPVTVTLVASDDASGVETTYYTLDSADPGDGIEYTAPFTVTDQGNTTVRFWSIDRIGQVEPIDGDNIAVVRIDSEPPSGSFVLDGDAPYARSTTVTAQMSFSDALEMRFDTGSGYPPSFEAYAPTKQLSLSGEGTHTVYGQFRDFLGNTATISDTITVDLTPPTSAAQGISDDWVVGPVTVSLEASDTASGVAATRYRIEGQAEETYTAPFDIAVEGETDVAFYSVDGAGNTETSQTVTVKIDSIPPSGTMQLEGGTSFTASTTVSVESSVTGAIEMRVDSGSGYGAWVAYAALATATVPGEGEATATVQYRDDASNVFELSDGITVDLTAPLTTSDALPEYSGSASIELTPSDALSGVASTHFKLDDAPDWSVGTSLAVHTAGEHTLTYYSVDNVGNAEESHIATFTIDTMLARRGGVDRYETAVEISQGAFDISQHVILATGLTYADALSASGLAGCLDAPILITATGSLPASIKAEIVRLGATDVTIVGGTAAVSSAVENHLRDDMGLAVERIGGSDRYEVSRRIAEEVRSYDLYDGRLFIASGEVGADALSLSPVVYSAKAPLVLTRRDAVPGDTRAALESGATSEAVLAGGPSAITEANLARMESMVGVAIERLHGADRYATTAAVSRHAVASGISSYSYVGVANGADASFPDSLCGGPALGRRSGVMVLTRADALPAVSRGVLEDAAGTSVGVEILGGLLSVSETVAGEVAAIFE